ncbi:MAG TPA: hypothetical protein RMG48_14025 [Myxococcales bacterium LLY-WYZ-16_1]|nr:hypothetical protein [Myxococcales bacterium LLY-WYZ-16_1]
MTAHDGRTDVEAKRGSRRVVSGWFNSDADVAKQAVQRIVDTGMSTAYPTNFGPVTQLEKALDHMFEWLDFSQRLMEEARDSDLRPTGGELA